MNPTETITTTQAAILGRAILPNKVAIEKEQAVFLAHLEFSQRDVDRMNELVAKAQSDDLSDQEEAELSDYRTVGNYLEQIKSKARLALNSLQ